MDDSEIAPLLEKVLNVLGKIILTCMYDIGNKHSTASKSLVLLTQSHSSTIAHEIIDLLRSLHGLPGKWILCRDFFVNKLLFKGWNQVLNAILIQKLNLAAYYLSDACLALMNEGPTCDQQHYIVVACLNVIGAWDSRSVFKYCNALQFLSVVGLSNN